MTFENEGGCEFIDLLQKESTGVQQSMVTSLFQGRKLCNIKL